MDVLNRTVIDGISTDEQEKVQRLASRLDGEDRRFLRELVNRASFDGWREWPELPDQKVYREGREKREAALRAARK